MNKTVYLIGAGMGGADTRTAAAAAAIEASELLIGAPRLLESYPDKRCEAHIAAEDIAARIEAGPENPVAVLLSGDVGFFSGAKGLWARLEGRAELVTLPGISSLSYFCARLRLPWQDVHVVSAHGRAHNAAGEIQRHARTFLLTGGKTRAQDICAALCRRGLGMLRVHVGEKLSYPDERIVSGSAADLAGQAFADLSVMLVENDRPIRRPCCAPGIPDSEFVRGEVPMTKEEVRVLAVSKLRLEAEQTLWDVGAGTGSVSVECALALDAGRVFAVEKKPAAVALIEQNKARFGVPNLEIVQGEAPEALAALPAPDRVFLGGTSGNLEAILRLALAKNPRLRVVATAVTLETLGEALRCFQALGLDGVEASQIAVTRTRRAGAYHMLDAQNPVWLLSGEGRA